MNVDLRKGSKCLKALLRGVVHVSQFVKNILKKVINLNTVGSDLYP